MLAGFGYKIAAVPFHMWAPDVYTGAPIPVTAFLSVGSKAAGFALLLRFFAFGVSTDGGPAPALTGDRRCRSCIAVLCVADDDARQPRGAGADEHEAAARLLDDRARRLHAAGLRRARATTGVRAVLFYLAVYYLMNLGAFLVVMLVANATGREDIDGFRGLAWRGGALPAVAMAIFLFSLTGLPPFAGFVGKFYLFAAGIAGRALRRWSLVGVLNSVVSLYYYARVVKTMFLDQPAADDPRVTFAWSDLGAVGAALGRSRRLLGLRFGWLLERATQAAHLALG